MFDEILDEVLDTSSEVIINSNIYVSKLLDVMDFNIPLSANDIMSKLEIKSKENFRDNYLNPAINAGLVSLTLPDKPTSKNQMYFKK